MRLMTNRATPFRSFAQALAVLGWRKAVRYSFWRFIEYFPTFAAPFTYELITPLVRYPLVCRRGTSDIQVFRQVFIERQYKTLEVAVNPRIIVDCGANIGLSAAYFLSLFPNSRVIAVEPDTENFRMLTVNLSPFSNRVEAFHAGIWSHACDLTVSGLTADRGNEWARRCQPVTQPTPESVRAFGMQALLDNNGVDEVDILKVDIEGAEEILFSASCESWINKIKTFAIEFHSDRAKKQFASAVAAIDGEFSENGEITVFRVLQR